MMHTSPIAVSDDGGHADGHADVHADGHAHRLRANRGITPARWGALGWVFVHLVALGYPTSPTPRDAAEYGRFITALGDVLPCRACRDHYREHVRQHPPGAALRAGRDHLFAWTVALHNCVNESLGRPAISLDAAIRLYAGAPLRIVPAHRRWADTAAGAVAAFAGLALCYVAASALAAKNRA